MGTPTQRRGPTPRKILVTGLLAGTLDGCAAILHFFLRGGSDPGKIFVYIASGVFGERAFAGDSTGMALWGVLFHYGIALVWTIIFVWMFPRIPFLHGKRLLTAAAFGLVVWTVMNRVVLPLSNVPPITFDPARALIAAGILIVCIGMPLSFILGNQKPAVINASASSSSSS